MKFTLQETMFDYIALSIFIYPSRHCSKQQVWKSCSKPVCKLFTAGFLFCFFFCFFFVFFFQFKKYYRSGFMLNYRYFWNAPLINHLHETNPVSVVTMTTALQGVNLATLTSSAAPSLQEFVLQGSILDGSCDALIHRLQALCDNVDDGIETFKDHEIVFTIRKYMFVI